MIWWRRLWERRQLEEHLDKELQFHLDQHADDLKHLTRPRSSRCAATGSRLPLGARSRLRKAAAMPVAHAGWRTFLRTSGTVPHVREEPQLHHHRCGRYCARHWREHRNLFRREYGIAETAAIPRR